MIEYWKGKLNEASSSCYELILAGVRKRQENIDCNGIGQNDISDAYISVHKDHPEIFYMGNSPRIVQRETKLIGLFSTSSVASLRKRSGL